jgi:hypothetical protein
MKLFRALKIGNFWVVAIKKAPHWESSIYFDTLWDCVQYCNEMNAQLAITIAKDKNQMELELWRR